LVQGKWGQALDCSDPPFCLYFDPYRNMVPRVGTLEFWVKSSPTNLWADDRDHQFVRLIPAASTSAPPRASLAMELIKRGKDNKLYLQVKPVQATLSVSVARLDPDVWHHVAFSWDFRDSQASLWLVVDGQGKTVTLPSNINPVTPAALQIGNVHDYEAARTGGGFQPLGGLLDDLHISDEPLSWYSADYHRLNIGPIDQQLALQAMDAFQRWLDFWAEEQEGGLWGNWCQPLVNYETRIYFNYLYQATDRNLVNMKYGSSGMLAYIYLQAYEYTGDERYLQVACNTGEFFLRAQQPAGYWLTRYIVDQSGHVQPASPTNIARIQDGYQSRPWLYCLYLYRVTGDSRYYAAAYRCADFLLEAENPNGSWPGKYDAAAGVGYTTGPKGVAHGCEYNDYATTDPLRMMITMYHLTGDPKFIQGTHGKGPMGIGQWMFDTDIGEGKVHGWCQQYDQNNQPVWARSFEAPVISPRVVNRFVGPMCLWFYLMTGQQRYMQLLKETYAWYKSVEVPGPQGGWYYQYLPDGTPVCSHDYETIKIDVEHPENNPPYVPKPSRGKLQLDEVEGWVNKYDQLGPQAFRQSFSGPTELTESDVHEQRLAAAQYCRKMENDEGFRKMLASQREDGAWVGKDVRLGTKVGRLSPNRLFRYIKNLYLARGVVPLKVLPRGGIGPWHHTPNPWQIPVLWCEDWWKVPVSLTKHEGE